MLRRAAPSRFALRLAMALDELPREHVEAAFLLAGCQTSNGTEGPSQVRASVFVIAPAGGDPPDFGCLEVRAGFALASDDARFGGLSGLWIAPDG